jgi:hypothetical protein
MSRRFSSSRPSVGGSLPHDQFGHLVGQFQFSSHIPLKGGRDTGRHIYLSVKIPGGNFAGIYECAVNIRSDEDTEVQYAQRLENFDSGQLPASGFETGVKLAYGTGTGDEFMGLTDGDFSAIVNDDLYNRVADLAQNCDAVGVYGVTYTDGDGIHDIHMNSGTNASDPHSEQDRKEQDGAIAFYFAMQSGGQTKAFANWIFIKFTTQSVVNYGTV